MVARSKRKAFKAVKLDAALRGRQSDATTHVEYEYVTVELEPARGRRR